jgi:hypothetical protein
MLGTTAATTDLAEGVFRQLVITGRSRWALYFARIPAGLAILVPLVGVTFGLVCVVTATQGSPQPSVVNESGVAIPLRLSEPQLRTWLLDHPDQAIQAFGPGPGSGPTPGPGQGAGPGTGPDSGTNSDAVSAMVRNNLDTIYRFYHSDEVLQLNPSDRDMLDVGLWLELTVCAGFLVGLGLGSLLGQRTVSTILMITLQVIVTPLLGREPIPYFLDGQRILLGVALNQLKPAALASLGGSGGLLMGGGGPLDGLPPMPTWAMITVIVGWLVGFTGLGAWRMATRDA